MFSKLKNISTLGAILVSAPLFFNTSLISSAHATVPLIQNSLAPLINQVLPSVVSVIVSGQREVSNNPFSGLIPDDLIPKGFGVQKEVQKYTSQGSGVIINNEKGYIVTNNHVIAGAQNIKINLADGRSFKAKIIGADPKTDLAVLEITDKFANLSALEIGNSDAMQIGDFVAAIGNPLGIGLTATTGIVSALSRNADLNEFESYIQTDASINRGNSGGALVNIKGELIGINSAIAAPNGAWAGIGFAIPSNIVKSITNQLIKKGQVDRSIIGIQGGNLTSDIAKSLKLSTNQGAFINEVLPGSPAAKAGIKSGDVIIGINGSKVLNFNQLRASISSMEPGTQITLDILNKDVTRQVTLTLIAANSENQQAQTEKNSIMSHDKTVIAYGITFDFAKDKIIVKDISQNSIADGSGLQIGDIVVKINDTIITKPAELEKILKENQNFLALQIKRGNTDTFIFLRPSSN